MRMWMVNPEVMCRRHLLGEHVELHMFVGSLQRKKNITGYIENDLLEPQSIIQRHKDIANEMFNRGYVHKSPLPVFDLSYLSEKIKLHKIDRANSIEQLVNRCLQCKMKGLKNG